jgi:uncharacterized integral membrane protein
MEKSMSSSTSPEPASPSSVQSFRWTPRWITGVVIVVVSLIFVFSNRGETTLQFLWFKLAAPGWVFLFVLLGAGFLSGWMIARSRYKS